jgi:hypothetical protein
MNRKFFRKRFLTGLSALILFLSFQHSVNAITFPSGGHIGANLGQDDLSRGGTEAVNF